MVLSQGENMDDAEMAEMAEQKVQEEFEIRDSKNKKILAQARIVNNWAFVIIAANMIHVLPCLQLIF